MTPSRTSSECLNFGLLAHLALPDCWRRARCSRTDGTRGRHYIDRAERRRSGTQQLPAQVRTLRKPVSIVILLQLLKQGRGLEHKVPNVGCEDVVNFQKAGPFQNGCDSGSKLKQTKKWQTCEKAAAQTMPSESCFQNVVEVGLIERASSSDVFFRVVIRQSWRDGLMGRLRVLITKLGRPVFWVHVRHCHDAIASSGALSPKTLRDARRRIASLSNKSQSASRRTSRYTSPTFMVHRLYPGIQTHVI